MMGSIFKKIYAVEGNIGAGKSTFLHLMKRKIRNIYVIQESLNEWKNIGGGNLFELFYKTPERWCFTFEICTMLTLFKNLREALATNTEMNFIERSILSNRVFHHVSRSMDKLNDIEMEILNEAYRCFKAILPKLSGVIYIDTDVKTCLKRIKERGRNEEQEIDEDYLTRLETEFIEINYDCPILCIDGKYNQNDPKIMLEEVSKFILNNN